MTQSPPSPVTVDRRGAVAVIRFDRKARANALSFEIMQALTAAARSFEDDTETAAIVLCGAPTVFSGGMDLKSEVWDQLPGMSTAQRRRYSALGPRLSRAFMALEPVTIAAIEGPCYAGGMALAAMCDFRVAGREATFAAPEVAVGLNMAWHSVPRLVRLVGAQATRRLLLTGATWDTAEAERLGFLDAVADPAGAETVALAMAEAVAARPRVATRMVKRAIEATLHGGDIAWSAADGELQLVNWQSPEFAAARANLTKKPTKKD
jgi:enoyl-CoA hydratase